MAARICRAISVTLARNTVMKGAGYSETFSDNMLKPARVDKPGS
jgi:hypothetical protein